MNFKLKTLVAAVVLAASATSANAVISLGDATTTGNSELVFSAWDDVAGVGYTYDLLSALTVTSFIGADTPYTANAQMLSNAVVSNSLITGPNGLILDVELTGIPFSSNLANVQWNLGAYDNVGRARALTTKDSLDAAPLAATQSQFVASVTGMNSYFSQANALVPTERIPLVDTYNTSIVADGPGYAGILGNNLAGLFDTTNALGSSSFVYLVARPLQSGTTGTTTQALFKQIATATGENLVVSTYQQAGQWRLNLSVAAVPEPETYAMFLAGLGIMGAVARRRKGQVK